MGYGRGGVRITGGEILLNGRDILRHRHRRAARAARHARSAYVAQSAAAAFNPAHR